MNDGPKTWKTNWFVESHGGIQPLSLIPWILLATARNINPKAEGKAGSKFTAAVEKAADIHYTILKAFRERYERALASSNAVGGGAYSLTLDYFNEMEKGNSSMRTYELVFFLKKQPVYPLQSILQLDRKPHPEALLYTLQRQDL